MRVGVLMLCRVLGLCCEICQGTYILVHCWTMAKRRISCSLDVFFRQLLLIIDDQRAEHAAFGL